MNKILSVIFFFMLVFFALDLVFFSVLRSQDHNPTILEEEIIVGIDDSFSEEELDLISEALLEWEESLIGQVSISAHMYNVPFEDVSFWADDNIITIYNATNFLSWPWHVAKQITLTPLNNCLGVTLLPSRDIFILENGELFKTIVKHEFGHVLCCQHSENKNDIMYSYASKESTEITKEDIDQALLCVENLGAYQ